MEKIKKKKNSWISVTVFVSVIIILCIWCFTYLLLKDLPYEERGTLGDMFGTINALFSGLAFAGIILTILLQRKELEYQRKELVYTREEFKLNRLTNVLFKQVEYLNTIVDTANLSNKNSLVNFVAHLEILEQHNTLDEIGRLLEENSRLITSLIVKVVQILKNFDNLIQDSQLEELDIQQLKRIFSNNINPHFKTILSYKLRIIEKQLKQKHKLEQIDIDILKLELRELDFIISY